MHEHGVYRQAGQQACTPAALPPSPMHDHATAFAWRGTSFIPTPQLLLASFVCLSRSATPFLSPSHSHMSQLREAGREVRIRVLVLPGRPGTTVLPEGQLPVAPGHLPAGEFGMYFCMRCGGQPPGVIQVIPHSSDVPACSQRCLAVHRKRQVRLQRPGHRQLLRHHRQLCLLPGPGRRPLPLPQNVSGTSPACAAPCTFWLHPL